MSPSSRSNAHFASARAGKVVMPLVVVAVVAAAVFAGLFKYGLLGAQAGPVVELQDAAAVDEEVAALVAEHVLLAKAAPQDAEQRATLAMVYEANELWDEAARSWQAALALAPDRPLWRYHLSTCTLNYGDNDLALEYLREAARELPASAAVHHRLGEMLLELGDSAGAQVEFRTAMANAPNHPDAHVGLAEALLRDGQFQQALELCEQALRLAPDHKRAHYNLGLAYRGLGRNEEATVELTLGLEARKELMPDELTARIEKFRTSYSVRLLRAARLQEDGHPYEAMRILEPVVAKHPDDVYALANLASVYVQLMRIDEAIVLLERAKAIDPEIFATYINLAAAELAREQPAKALVHLDEAARRAPTVGRLFDVRARALGRLGRWREAYNSLQTSTRLDASSGLTYLFLGDTCLILGLLDESIESFTTAARLLPSQPSAHVGLARVWMRIEQPQKARAAYLRALELAPNNPLVLQTGRELQKKGY